MPCLSQVIWCKLHVLVGPGSVGRAWTCPALESRSWTSTCHLDTHWPFTGFRWTLKLGDSSLGRARDTQRYAGMLIRLLASSSLLLHWHIIIYIGWRTAPILRQTRLDGREPRRNCSVGDQRSQLTALNGRNGLTMSSSISTSPDTINPPQSHVAPLLRLTRLWPKPTLAGPAPQRATQCRVRVSGPPMSSRSDRPTECFKARF